MPNQEDYGTEQDPDVSLVPDTLRTYRHFTILDGELHPMSSGSLMDPNPYSLGGPQPPPPRRPTASSWNAVNYYDWSTASQVPDQWYKVPSPYDPYYTQKYCDCSSCKDKRGDEFRASGATFTAKCRRKAASSAWDFGLGPTVPKHDAPQKDCTCGFYAHYDPYTDFYPGTLWAYEVEPDVQSWFGVKRCILVRTVVEMSGKVVMGSRGVRAEKMKIVAAAVDWQKFKSVERYSYRSVSIVESFSSIYEDMLYSRKPDPATQDRVQEEFRYVMGRYGIEGYTYHRDMYDKYPQPDISHLLGDSDETG